MQAPTSPRTEWPQAVAEAVTRATEDARAQWPGVTLATDDWHSFLARRVGGALATTATVEGLRVGDLYLACACLLKVPQGLELLERKVMPQVAPGLRSFKADPSFIDDVLQVTRERILGLVPGGEAKLSEYEGQGALVSWVRVVAMRIALDMKKGAAQKANHVDVESVLADVASDANVEGAALKGEHRDEVRRVLLAVMQALAPDDKNLLRWAYAEGLSVDDIGTLLGVHRATAARRIAKVRETMLNHTRAMLGQSLALGETDADSLVRTVQSTLDLSLRQVLKDNAS